MQNDDDQPTSAEDADSGGGLLSEDWLAVFVGLGILALALAGFVPRWMLW